MINKGVLKFPEKKETMLVDEDPFPPVATVNTTTFDLRSLINHKRRMREEMKRKRKPLYKNVWVRKSETLERAEGSSNQEGSSRFQAFPKKHFQKNSPRFIVPPKVAPGNQWHRVQHKKFPQSLTRTQKRRLQRQRALERRMEELKLSPQKSKFRRKATEDEDVEEEENHMIDAMDENESVASSKETGSVKITSFLVGSISITLNCATASVILPPVFRANEAEDDVIEIQREVPLSKEPLKAKEIAENDALSGVTIQAPKGGGPKRVILEKPSVEMTRHIRPLYIKAHLNGKPISRVLIDDGSVMNVIPSRTLVMLGRTEEDLIPTDVTMSAFTGEVTKVLGVLPMEITVGSKTSLTAFFIVNSSASYNVLLGRDWIYANGCVPSSLY